MTSNSSPSTPGGLEFANDGRVTLHFGNDVVTVDYREHLEVDPENLDEALIRQPGLYAYYSRLLGMQKALLETAKNEFKEYQARIYTFIKQRLQVGLRRPTEAEVSAKIAEDGQYKARKQRLVEMQLQLDFLWSIRDGLVQKKDCLITLAANRRREWDADLHVNKSEKRQSLEETKRNFEEKRKKRE